MNRLNSEITLGDNVARFVTEVSIESSWKTLTDTASIVLPKKITKNGEPIFIGDTGLFKKGDAVEIKLGYYPNLLTRFKGYIAGIVPDSPLQIECEDEMYLLKRKDITKSFKSVSLKDLLTEILKDTGVSFEAVDAELGQFRITRATPAQVLEQLKKTYALQSFIKDGVLRVGLSFYPEEGNDVDIVIERDVIDPSSLEYKKEDDVRLKVKVISMLLNNKKLEVDVGDPDGEVRTLHVYNITSEKELKAIGERELPKFRYEGYFGSFETFLEPQIKQGDRINLGSKKFVERAGIYRVDDVDTTFGQGGGRQIVQLGAKI